MILGWLAKERAIVTRCCSPPDSCDGYRSSLCDMPTRSSKYKARRLRSVAVYLPVNNMGISTFAKTVSVGNKLNDWNIKPISCSLKSANFVSLVDGKMRLPNKYKSPLECRSIVPIIDSSVDLPHPDKPHTTTNWRLYILNDTLRSAGTPSIPIRNVLLTPSSLIISSLGSMPTSWVAGMLSLRTQKLLVSPAIVAGGC
mmetsp:Transcript_16371/g.28640  ORF Transcript_16371/g.28640 Transcript_16371/m.28640 type:complete len:199 (-) Transcript_16371:241-837(-)